MSEQSLAEILNQLREERVACEQVLASVNRLAAGELKGIFDKAITLAKLEAQIANPDISGEVTMAMSNATTQLTFVSSQLEESTVLLEKRTEELKRFQHRCIMLGGVCFALAISCSIFIGWTGYSYWFIKATTSSFWFQKIIVENAEVINKCLNPEVIKHSQGHCTIQLPVRAVH